MVAPFVFVLGGVSIILSGCWGGRASRMFLELGRESFSWSGCAVFRRMRAQSKLYKSGLMVPFTVTASASETTVFKVQKPDCEVGNPPLEGFAVSGGRMSMLTGGCELIFLSLPGQEIQYRPYSPSTIKGFLTRIWNRLEISSDG
jgi:hypothetical protein